jgi:ADP-heptose:LPS heptosyltransferase
VRNDRVGDLVLTLPALQAARRQWSRAHLTALVSPTNAQLLSGTGYVDEMLIDNPADDSGKLAARLRAKNFDAAMVFNSSTRNCLAVWRAGIKRRVTWAFKPAGLLLGNCRVMLHRTHPPIHEAEFAMAFVRRLGGAAVMENLSPALHIDPLSRERMRQRVERELGTTGPLFGVHPGNGASAFNWPIGRYVELIDRLAMHGRVMVTGGAGERELLDSIRGRLAHLRCSRIGYYSDLSLNELVASISDQAALTISSTGPMHIAGILGTPVVALFSPHPVHSPAKWAPLGAGHTLFVAPLEAGENPHVPRERGEMVMGRIRVDDVLAANLNYAQKRLSATSPLDGWARAS